MDKPPNHGLPWTPEHIALLRTMFGEMASLEEMMQVLGRGAGAICSRLQYLGLLYFNPSEQAWFPKQPDRFASVQEVMNLDKE